MALQLDNFCGFETQGGHELTVSTGTPGYDTTIFRGFGATSLLLTGSAGENVDLASNAGTTSAGTGKIVSFYFRASSVNGSNNFLQARTSSASIWSLAINVSDDGKISFAGNASASVVITINTWHLIQVYWDNVASGAVTIYVDGVEAINLTGEDMSGTLEAYRFNNSSASATHHYDDFACWSGAAGVSEFLADYSIKKYQAKGTSLTEGGDALTNGTWDATGDTPGVDDADGTAAEYDGGALSGWITTDAGSETDVGPNTDSDVDTIVGAKWVHRLKRGTGSGTTHNAYVGNSGDGVTAKTKTVGASYGNHMTLSVAAGEMPTTNEYFRSGFGKGAGGREIFCAEQWAMLLFEPPTGGGRTTKNTRSNPLGQNIGMATRMTG
jgi:hypothetical protein